MLSGFELYSRWVPLYFLFDFTETGSIKERFKIKTLNHFVLLRPGLLLKLAAIVDCCISGFLEISILSD